VVKKRYGIRRNKIFILFYTTIIGGVIFFNSYWKVKKATRIWGFRIDKKLSPDRSVLNLF
jgi:hypothetical protein